MPQIDIDILAPLAAKCMEGAALTPAERMEILRIAQGYCCKDSAAASDISPETVRARRKRIYRKIAVSGASEVIARLLALSLKMLAKGEQIGQPVAPIQSEQRDTAPAAAAAR